MKKGAKVKNKDKREEVAHLKDQLARLLADYDNLSKRVEKEREEFGLVANTKLVLQLLPALDMFYSAQSHLNDQGLAIAISSLESALADKGFEKISVSPGEIFNEELHDAVEVVDEDSKKDGEILGVGLTGWKIKNGPVIRPAKVKVNKKI